MTGTNAGGLFVLEPWITPSLFYRFLGKPKGQTAMDSYSFCEVLGPVEGRRIMDSHMETFYVEAHFKELAEKGIEIIRLPVGDWTMKPWGPYVGCMDGQAEKITWFLDMCHKYGIKVLMDLHAMKDSQNGYDNSGKTTQVTWSDDFHYTHKVEAHFWGPWNEKMKKYDYINEENLQWGLDVHESLLKKYGSHPAFYAYEPLNEPQTNPPIQTLKRWYRASRKLVQKYAPQAKFVFHDAMVEDPAIWDDLFADDDMHNVVMDVHQYSAWTSNLNTTEEVCKNWETYTEANSRSKYETWCGEWALATDTCAMYLMGWNNAYMNPQHECAWVDCPKPYMPKETAVDLDRTVGAQGPFG